jgi:predicted dehydrogenase
MNQLKTALLGIDERGQLLLEAAAKVDYFQIQAVADKDAELAKKTADKYGCLAYDDYRQLIIQNQFDCLLVAAGTYSCDEYVRMAMKKKCNILKLFPPARNFAEAEELVRLAEEENIKFTIANPNRFAQSFLTLKKFLQENRIEQIFLITAVYNGANEHTPPWQADPKLAGGGVLLHNCYEIIDQIVWNFGIPQQVYSLNTNQAADKQQRLYLTEDTAVVTMKFADTLFGTLTAGRTIGPGQNSLKIYGKDKTLTVSDNLFVVSDHLGQTIEEVKHGDDRICRMKDVLENFALSILSPDTNRLYSSGKENLKNMAVIESAYLSGRTGMPEEPARILQIPSSSAVTAAI